MTESNQLTGMVKVCALWDGKTQKGARKQSGNWGDAHVIILPNPNKEPGSKQPDYNMYMVPRIKKVGTPDRGKVAGQDTFEDSSLDPGPPHPF